MCPNLFSLDLNHAHASLLFLWQKTFATKFHNCLYCVAKAAKAIASCDGPYTNKIVLLIVE